MNFTNDNIKNKNNGDKTLLNRCSHILFDIKR